MTDRKRLDPAQRRRLLASPAGWLACGFGSGLAPMAQGTVGSLAALAAWTGLRALPWPAYALLLAVAFAVGIRACDLAGRALGIDDHRALVWDEFVGLWLTLVPLGWWAGSWWWGAALGFLLFRLFDVAKPWPVGWLDRRVKGGLGVMLDDVAAGTMAGLVLAVVGVLAG